jgi:hypothetical protein
MTYVGLLVLSVLLSGCVHVPDGEELSSYASRLNERGITSCVAYEVHAAGYATLRGITATGGADLATCLGQRW